MARSDGRLKALGSRLKGTAPRSLEPRASSQCDLLWAPWRKTFLSANRRRRGCFFCRAKRSTDDRRHHVVLRGTDVFCLLNRYPYNNGHVMIAPYRHVGELSLLRSEEWNEALEMIRTLLKRLRQRLRAQGFNLGINLGRVAGAGIPGHLHFHVVPRWQGDTNFMPMVSHTKVISQSLGELYTQLTRR